MSSAMFHSPHTPNEGIIDRRRRPEITATVDILRELPALLLLDRVPIPVIAVGSNGVLDYTNPAFATMLGHPRTATLIGEPLSSLLVGLAHTAPCDCLCGLKRATGAVVDWCHAQGFPVHTVVSQPLLVRGTDQTLLITITDVTEQLWTYPARPCRSHVTVVSGLPAGPPAKSTVNSSPSRD